MPRSSEQNEKIKDERREQILVNALKLFAKRGLIATKISDIAKVSGFSQGLVYHYFKSKEDIFNELVKQALDASSQAMLMMEKLPLEPLEKIQAIAKMIIDGFASQDESAYYFLLMTQASISDANPEEAKRLMQNSFIPFEVMIRIVLDGQKKGVICKDNPADLVMIFWATINGLAHNKIIQGENFLTPDSSIIARIFS